MVLIGETQAQLPQLRIREAADLAGLSLLLVLWKVLIRSELVNSFLSQSSSSLIATDKMMAAQVVAKSGLSPMPKAVRLSLSLTTDTLLRMAGARLTPAEVELV